MSGRLKKSILFLPRWYPNKKDIQLGTFIRQQALLLKDDFDIHVIYVQADDSLKATFEIIENKQDGINEQVVYFKTGNGILSKVINAKRYRKAQDMAYKRIKTKIDLCHVHVPYRSAFLALRLNKTHGTPFVITEHWSGHLNGEYQKKNSADKLMLKKVLKKAAAISCVSHLLASKFKLNTGFDATVIPNYIESSENKSKSTSTHVEILSVCDFADGIKNITGLLQGFSTALKKNPSLHLTLIGGGPDEEKIHKKANELELENFIYFKGRLAHQEVLSSMQNCDFYICNSNFETFGMTVAEALRSGKPVISTRCGGPEEFLTADNCLLIQPKNTDQLTKAILKMADEYKNFDGQNISNSMEQKFGRQRVKRMWVEFYNSAISL